MMISEAAKQMKYELDFRDVAKRYGVDIKRGNVCCPFHNEKTPSFSAKRRFGKCFSCGWYGDIFDLTGGLLGLTYTDSVKRVAADFGYNFDFDAPVDPLAKRKEHESFLRRKREREQAQKLVEIIENRLDMLYRVLRLYEQWIDEYKPECITDGIGTRYAEAVSQIDKVRYDINCSEDELRRAKEKMQ